MNIQVQILRIDFRAGQTVFIPVMDYMLAQTPDGGRDLELNQLPYSDAQKIMARFPWMADKAVLLTAGRVFSEEITGIFVAEVTRYDIPDDK